MSAGKYFIFLILIKTCCAMMYLHEAQYDLMPPIFYMDDYEECVMQTDWVYCIVDINLIPDERGPLSTMIQDYSRHYMSHYDHSLLTHGICVQESCPRYCNSTTGIVDPKALERCLSDMIWKRYKLKTKLLERPICTSSKDKRNVTAGDVAVYCVIVLIIALNVSGLFHDLCFNCKQDTRVTKFSQCFSISNNWKTLFETRNKTDGNQMVCTTSLDGVRAICMLFVVIFHSPLGFAAFYSNPQFYEQAYDWSVSYLIFNGHFVVNVFFILSSFLLVYDKQITASGFGNIKLILSNITARYLRLTPPYAVVLAFNITCLQLLHNVETQLLWQKVIGEEIQQCRKYYMTHLLYANNYNWDAQCLPQTWHVAADMQLYVLGVSLCVLAKRPAIRNFTLATLFIASLLLPALSTYYYGLHGILITTPENCRRNFSKSNDFLYLYRPGHMNVSCFIMGMALAYFVNHLQKTTFSIQKYKKYSPVYWATVPATLVFIIFGKLLYVEAPRQPLWIRVAAAASYKPIFGILITIIIFGQLLKLENTYSRVLRWPGWGPPSRISYCVYLTHFNVMRLILVNETTLVHNSVYFLVMNMSRVLVMSLLSGLLLWLTVEAPASNLVHLFSKRRENHHKKQKSH